MCPKCGRASCLCKIRVALSAIALLFALALMLPGCANVRSMAREIVRPCSDAHPCGQSTRQAKCTPVMLCGPSADGKQRVCESSANSGAWPPICAEKEKEKP